MYEYLIKNKDQYVDSGECAFRDLPKLIDHYGEKNFEIKIKKLIDQSGNSTYPPVTV